MHLRIVGMVGLVGTLTACSAAPAAPAGRSAPVPIVAALEVTSTVPVAPPPVETVPPLEPWVILTPEYDPTRIAALGPPQRIVGNLFFDPAWVPSGPSTWPPPPVTGPCAPNQPTEAAELQAWLTNPTPAPPSEVTVCARNYSKQVPSLGSTIRVTVRSSTVTQPYTAETGEQGVAAITLPIGPVPVGDAVVVEVDFGDVFADGIERVTRFRFTPDPTSGTDPSARLVATVVATPLPSPMPPPTPTPDPSALRWDEPLQVPSEVRAGEPFQVTVLTDASGCMSPGDPMADTEVVMEGNVATITAYDYYSPPDGGCTADLSPARHTAMIQFMEPGEGIVRYADTGVERRVRVY